MTTNNPVNTGLSGTTGSGNFVGANTPTLITPVLGAATATSINFGGSTLSNYVTNTSFTPGMTIGGSSTGITFSVQNGIYARIGSIVHFSVDITMTSRGGLTGAVVITGLPLTASSAVSTNYVASINTGNVTYSSGQIIAAFVTSNTSVINLYIQATGTTVSTLQASTNVGDTSIFYINGSYLV